MRLALAILVTALFIPATSNAQQPAEPAQTEISPSHLEVGRELVTLLNIGEISMQGATMAFEQQVRINPELGNFVDILEDWVRSVFTGDEAITAFARVYAEEISEEDLIELVAFYKTPAGQRIAGKQFELILRGAQLGEELAASRQGELAERMQQREQELLNQSQDQTPE